MKRLVPFGLVCLAAVMALFGSSASARSVSPKDIARKIAGATEAAPVLVSVEHLAQGTQIDKLDKPAGFFVETLNGKVSQLITKTATYTHSSGGSCYRKTQPTPLVDFAAELVPSGNLQYKLSGHGRLKIQGPGTGGQTVEVTYDSRYRITVEKIEGHGKPETVSYPRRLAQPARPHPVCG